MYQSPTVSLIIGTSVSKVMSLLFNISMKERKRREARREWEIEGRKKRMESHGWESWTRKKAELPRIDDFDCGAREDS